MTKPAQKTRLVTRRNIKAVDCDTFGAEAAAQLRDRPPSSEAALYFDSALRSLLDTHASATTKRITDRPSAPWHTPNIRTAKKQRRRAERRWRRTRLEIHRQIYNSRKMDVQTLILESKQAHFNKQITQTTSTKSLFTIMNTLLGSSTDSPLPSNTDPSELPKTFSDFFHNKIQNIRDKLKQASFHPTPSLPPFSGTPLTDFSPLTLSDLKKVIKTVTVKTCDLDPLPTQLYSSCLPYLLPAILEIINTSLLSGTFPDPFKTAIVKPLLKKSTLDPNVLSNYRPVSNLSFISKLLERVVLNQLNSHLLTNNLLSPVQSAYRPHHSTETALLKITSDLLAASDIGDISLLTLLDLSAAFDTVDHDTLLDRLQYTFGVQGSALSWFHSYLTNRYQSVSINNVQSDHVKLECGVPQGSVLGPVLFSLYTQPLDNTFDSHSLLHHSFADDSQLYDSAPPQQSDNVFDTTSSCISEVQNWMTENRLQLNSNKTEAILIGTKTKLATINNTSLNLSNTSIPLSSHVKNLGVTLDNTLSMKHQISSISRICYFHLRRIATIRNYLTKDATAKLITSTVLSRLDYCNSLLAGLPSSSLSKLQRIQNSSARLVLRKKKTDHITPLLRQLHWLPIPERISYKLNTLTYQCIHKTAPSYLTEMVSLYSPSRSLRSADDPLKLKTPKTRLVTAGQRSFAFQSPYHWNSLPLSLRQKTSLSSFKSSLKTFLFPK